MNKTLRQAPLSTEYTVQVSHQNIIVLCITFKSRQRLYAYTKEEQQQWMSRDYKASDASFVLPAWLVNITGRKSIIASIINNSDGQQEQAYSERKLPF